MSCWILWLLTPTASGLMVAESAKSIALQGLGLRDQDLKFTVEGCVMNSSSRCSNLWVMTQERFHPGFPLPPDMGGFST